jgi:hypothetical protein
LSWDDDTFDIYLLDLDTMHPFDTLELASLLRRDEHDSMTICTRSTSTTDTVDICLWIVWDMVVDYESDIVEIESSRCDICTDEYSDFTRFECFDRPYSISLHHISVDIGRWESITVEVSLEFLSLVFASGEYDHLVIRESLESTLEKWVLVTRSNTHEYMIDRIYCRCLREDEWLISTLHIVIDQVRDLASICRWECHDLLEWLELFPDLDNRSRKPHIHHLIHLVDDEHRDRREVDSTTLDHIHETTWSRDDDLWSVTELLDLATDRESTEHSKRAHTHISRDIDDLLTSLHSELTSRFEDEDLWLAETRIDTIEGRDDERSSLTRSSIGLDDDVLVFEGDWDDSSLYLSRLSIAEFGNSGDDLSTEC